jgi:hypothetical protein
MEWGGYLHAFNKVQNVDGEYYRISHVVVSGSSNGVRLRLG